MSSSTRTALSELLAALWRELLGMVRVAPDDDFFDHGGNHAKAVLMADRLQEELGACIHPATIHDAPTVAACEAYLRQHYPGEVARLEGHPPTLPPQQDAALAVDERCLEQFRLRIAPLRPGAGRPDERKTPPAVFLLSAPRSGSTLLRVLLAGHPDLFAPPELNLLSFDSLGQRKAACSGRHSFLLEGCQRAVMQLRDCDREQAERILYGYEAKDLPVADFYRLL